MQTVIVKLSKLRHHPLQEEVYGDLIPKEFEALKKDIKSHKLRQPIEVTDDDVIIDGHQRIRALLELGIEEAPAIIVKCSDEYDLNEQFLRANFQRRHLDVVAKARVLLALYKLESERSGERFLGADHGDFRDFIAKQLGGQVSGRTIDRYSQLLRLPRIIQDAVSQNDVTMSLALKVEKQIDDAGKALICDRISNGNNAKHAIEQALDDNLDRSAPTTAKAFRKLVKLLQAELENFKLDESKVASQLNDSNTELLVDATQFFTNLIELNSASSTEVAWTPDPTKKARKRLR